MQQPTEQLRCQYCNRELKPTPLNKFHRAGWKCAMNHGRADQRALLHQQHSAHTVLGFDPDQPVTAAQLQKAAAEWMEMGYDNPTALRYLMAVELVAELHGLAVPSSAE
jgi:hypothetical protein